MIKNTGDKMNDKTKLIFMIVNIVVLCLIMALISSSKRIDKTKPELISGETKIKKCSLSISTDNDTVTNSSNLKIYYTNNIIDKYSINYELSYVGNKETEIFKIYKTDYENLINRYQGVENVSIMNYSYVDNVFTFTLDYKLIPNDNNELVLNYNQSIDDAIYVLTSQGYVCE